MKDRNILYFITAIIASILLVMSIVIRFFKFFQEPDYADIVLLDYYYYIIPVAILWFGWYFEDETMVLISASLFAVFAALHIEHIGVLVNSPYVTSNFAPTVKTIYLLGLVLMVATSVAGFFGPIKKRFTNK